MNGSETKPSADQKLADDTRPACDTKPARNARPRFQEIDVQRINIVDADGKVRMAISGKDKAPGWVFSGKHYPGRPKHAGITFYNDDGEECGGLIFGNSGAGLMFDQREQDQIIGLMYNEENDSRWYGLNIWDRPETPMAEMIDRYRDIRSMPEGPERTRLMREFNDEFPAPLRIFLGREKTPEKNEAQVRLTDSKGRTRIRMIVDSDDSPRVEILDEDGKVIHRIPPSQSSS